MFDKFIKAPISPKFLDRISNEKWCLSNSKFNLEKQDVDVNDTVLHTTFDNLGPGTGVKRAAAKIMTYFIL